MKKYKFVFYTHYTVGLHHILYHKCQLYTFDWCFHYRRVTCIWLHFVPRLNRMRPLFLSTQTTAKPKEDNGSVKNAPIKFSTSKGGPAAWKVTHSLGSKHQRPWWKALPISLVFISVLLWCSLRNETDIDGKLGEHLLTKLPGLLPEEDEDENSW